MNLIHCRICRWSSEHFIKSFFYFLGCRIHSLLKFRPIGTSALPALFKFISMSAMGNGRGAKVSAFPIYQLMVTAHIEMATYLSCSNSSILLSPELNSHISSCEGHSFWGPATPLLLYIPKTLALPLDKMFLKVHFMFGSVLMSSCVAWYYFFLNSIRSALGTCTILRTQYAFKLWNSERKDKLFKKNQGPIATFCCLTKLQSIN